MAAGAGHGSPQGFAAVSFRDDQADALRRRRLSDPMVALGDSVQHAGLPERPRRGRARRAGARARRRDPPAHLRRDQPAGPAGSDHPDDPQGRRPGADRRSSACSPTSFRAPSISPGRSSPPGCRSASAASTSPAASPCCRRCRRRCARRRRWASRFFAGEAEDGRLDEVLRDACNGTLEPLYNYMDELPALQGEPPPILPHEHVRRTSGSLSSIDLGRGCPYQCSFCTIINVQGRKSRFRSRRRPRTDRARELRAGHQALLHHRRQPRPQPRLGGAVRPPDRAAGRRGDGTSASPSRSTRSATRSRTSSRRRRRPACAASSSGWRTSIPTT